MRAKQKIVHCLGPSNINLGIFVFSFTEWLPSSPWVISLNFAVRLKTLISYLLSVLLVMQGENYSWDQCNRLDGAENTIAVYYVLRNQPIRLCLGVAAYSFSLHFFNFAID